MRGFTADFLDTAPLPDPLGRFANVTMKSAPRRVEMAATVRSRVAARTALHPSAYPPRGG